MKNEFMRSIFFAEDAQDGISIYSRNYRMYYEALYRDSGLWSEDQIINGYINESIQREDEIYTAITEHLSGKYDIIKTLQ
jgi:hypothetical protein